MVMFQHYNTFFMISDHHDQHDHLILSRKNPGGFRTSTFPASRWKEWKLARGKIFSFLWLKISELPIHHKKNFFFKSVLCVLASWTRIPLPLPQILSNRAGDDFVKDSPIPQMIIIFHLSNKAGDQNLNIITIPWNPQSMQENLSF